MFTFAFQHAPWVFQEEFHIINRKCTQGRMNLNKLCWNNAPETVVTSKKRQSQTNRRQNILCIYLSLEQKTCKSIQIHGIHLCHDKANFLVRACLRGEESFGNLSSYRFFRICSCRKTISKSLMFNKCFRPCLLHITTECFFYTKNLSAMDSPLSNHQERKENRFLQGQLIIEIT